VAKRNQADQHENVLTFSVLDPNYSRLVVSQSHLSAVEHRRNEVGAEVLLAINRGFGKSLDWLLTGED